MSAPERTTVTNLQMTVALAVILVLQLCILATRPSPDEGLRKQLAEVNLKLEALALRNSAPRSETTSATTADSSSAASDEFNEAVSLTEVCLAKQDFSAAFDMILAASRIAPSNPRLLDLVTEFVENAKSSKSDDTEALVDELLDRCDPLVHYQRPQDVVSSRHRLQRLRMPFVRTIQPSVVGSRFESVLNFLLIAENSSVPLGMRSKAADRARQDLESTLLNTITSAKELPELLNSDEVKQLSSRIENVEKQSVIALFQQSRTKVDQWLSEAGSLQSASDSVESDRVPEISSNISAIIARGYDQLEELTRFT
ncbi:MAG: hypothetical protein U0941_17825 [Planctomycetaceae bacterium]